MDITTAHIGIVTGVAGFLMALSTYLRGRYKSNDLVLIENRLIKLETKIDPLWDVLQSEALKGLKSNPDPSHVQRDTLIDKYLSGDTLSREEARFLVHDFMSINEGKATGNKGLAVLGIAVLASQYREFVEDLLKTNVRNQ